MTLSGTIRYIERIALMQPSVKMVVPNDIFRLNATPEAEYAVFGWTQGQHSIGADDSYVTYSFTFFYVDRLTEDKGNQLEIQSVGITVLDNIIRTIIQAGIQVAGSYTFTSFNQRFVDECAGVFCAISLRVPLDSLCEDTYFDFNDDFNDDYASGGLQRDSYRGGVLGPDRDYAAPDADDFYPRGGGSPASGGGPGGGGPIVVNIPVKDVTLGGVSVVVDKVAVLPAYPKTLAELLPDEYHNVVTEEQIETWNGKQDEILDLDEIRSGAEAGETAYQKPANGIPASDIASGVIPDVSQFITKSVNDLVNYYKKTETYTQTEVNNLIGAIQHFHYEIATSTSAVTDPSNNVLYLIGPTGTGADKYEEYVYTTEWVKIGDTSIDLSGYVTTGDLNTALANYTNTTDLTTLLAGKQDKIDSDHKLDYSLLSNTPTIPAAQVNADWNADSGVAQILNKPTIPVNYAGSATPGGPADKALSIPFGEVDADSTSTDIKATVNNFPSTLENGVFAYIRNNAIASASGWTLNVNGTGAKPVYASNADATRTTTVFSAAVTYLFIYNSTRVEGGCWDMYYGYNANDNTIGYNLRTNKMSLPTTSACYRYRLLFTSADGTHFVPANASSSTNATAKRTTTQTPIDPFGSIRYYSSTAAVTSGNRPGATYLWEQYELTLGYSFNQTGAALVLTQWKPVYIKCAPQTDGSAIIDADNPYVQDLPATADGRIYIYLGVAISATQVEMVFHHPVYYRDANGRKRTWTGEEIII